MKRCLQVGNMNSVGLDQVKRLFDFAGNFGDILLCPS